MARDKKKKPTYVDLHLGPLPVEAINRTLGHELEPGDVIFTAAAQAHAYRSHRSDFPRCLPHVGAVAITPQFLGDDFKNLGKIELVARVPSLGSGVSVALVIEPDANGRYNVCSLYPVSYRTIENRRQDGHLIITKWR